MQQTQRVFPPRYLHYAHHITSLQTLLPYLVGSHGCRRTGHCTFPITIVMQSAPCSSRNSSDGLATADFIHSLLQQTKGASALNFFLGVCYCLQATFFYYVLKQNILQQGTQSSEKNQKKCTTLSFKYILCVFFKFSFLFVKNKLCKRIVIDGWCVVSKGKDAISLPAADRAR